MCYGNCTKAVTLEKVDHDVNSTSEHQYIAPDIPEHCDDPFLNRSLKNGILGSDTRTKQMVKRLYTQVRG